MIRWSIQFKCMCLSMFGYLNKWQCHVLMCAVGSGGKRKGEKVWERKRERDQERGRERE